MRYSYAQGSVTGPVRSNNEDYLDVIKAGDQLIIGVADGLGGCPYGEIASRVAVDTALGFLKEELPCEDIEDKMDLAFNKANVAILKDCADEPEHIGMCSTLTVAVLSGLEIHIGHYGDCRAYLVSDNELIRLTSDHNLAETLLREGKITEEEAKVHAGRSNLIKCLGENMYIRPDLNTYNAKYGDCVILATDGMYSLFDEDTVRDILNGRDDLDALVDLLMVRGASDDSKDNSTVAVIRFDSGDEEDGV
ncbi:MAG: serine/threonine-protein phosphatase [Clostridiales bacterium]|nr:serine/threonine-protein phosphatase [Clostridiales bacterium]